MERHRRAKEARLELAGVVNDLVSRFGLQKKEVAAALQVPPFKLSWMLSEAPPRPTTEPPAGWRTTLAGYLAQKGGALAEHARTIDPRTV